MRKQSTAFDITLPPKRQNVASYQWLYESLRDQILEGHLRPGSRLPATRDMARQYSFARGTVVNAFERLQSEGYVEGTVGSGTYVSRVLPDDLLRVQVSAERLGATPKRAKKRAISDYGKRVLLFGGYERGPVRAFRANLPALNLFPVKTWTQLTTRCLKKMSVRNLMDCDAMGEEGLRHAVSDYLVASRGVKCEADQVAIVSGVQEAIDIAARLFLDPGDEVGMERPGYPGAALAFAAVGAKIRAIGLDQDGIRLNELPQKGMRLLYVTPGHQFPLGTTMSLARRLELLQWAGTSGAMILEDDYDGEYRYSGKPIPALQGLDPRGCVLYAGSFSKVMFPALRLGYLVVPDDLVDRVRAIKSLTTRHAPVLEQLVLREFIEEGHFGRHLRRMRQIYAERLAILVEEARARLAGVMKISEVEAGLQTVGWLKQGTAAEAVARAALERGVEVTPLSRYAGEVPSRHPVSRRYVSEGLQLGFAALDGAEIRRGMHELAIVLERLMRSER